jgi:cytochrome b
MKTYIWTIPTRLFHWLLTAGVVTAYILGETEGSLNLHSSIGYMVGVLILFRIIWGLVGPKYSHFADFPISPGKIKAFFKDMNLSKNASPGHNPLASLVMLAIILVTLVIVLSGIGILSAEKQGLFQFISFGNNEDLFGEIHEAAVTVLVILTIIHLIGNAVDFIFHRETGTLQSMFTGYKNAKGKSVVLNKTQIIIATLGIVAAMAIFPYSLANQNITDKENTEQNDEMEEEDDD